MGRAPKIRMGHSSTNSTAALQREGERRLHGAGRPPVPAAGPATAAKLLGSLPRLQWILRPMI